MYRKITPSMSACVLQLVYICDFASREYEMKSLVGYMKCRHLQSFNGSAFQEKADDTDALALPLSR